MKSTNGCVNHTAFIPNTIDKKIIAATGPHAGSRRGCIVGTGPAVCRDAGAADHERSGSALRRFACGYEPAEDL